MSDEPLPESVPNAVDRHARLHRWMVVLGPLGLAINILLSLWVSYGHVTHSVNVHVDTHWHKGERLAVRGQLVDSQLKGVDGASVEMKLVDASGTEHALGSLEAIPKAGLSQGTLTVPTNAADGEGTLVLEFAATLPDGIEATATEEIPVTLGGKREAREPTVSIARSMLQWADDTEDQPKDVRIDLQPYGRLLAGFRNTLLVRVTDPDGKPWDGEVVVALEKGEFAGAAGPGELGKPEDYPELERAHTDRLGIVAVHGRMDSDVLRVEVRLVKPVEPALPGETPPGETPPGETPPGETPPTPPTPPGETPPGEAPAAKPDDGLLAKRHFRLVSFSGSTQIRANRLLAQAGDEVELTAEALRANRPIFVDVHAPDGTWVDTLTPPLRVTDDPRPWTLPQVLDPGFLHFEAYAYTNSPGESSAVATLLVASESDAKQGGLKPLIERQRDRLKVPRTIKGFEPEREKKYLDRLEALVPELDDATRAKARQWLMGSLPVEVFGPPLALTTRQREVDAMAAWQAKWILGLRAFLWGGGGLFILVFFASLLRQHRSLGVATSEALDDDSAEDTLIHASLSQARRELVGRAIVVLVILVSALLLTAMMLESFVWEH